MKSKSAKGNDFQDWIEDWILKNHPGSIVHNQKAVSKIIKIRNPKTGQLEDRWISQRNDIFGCIDLVWVGPGGRLTFIQATLDTGIGRKLKDLLVVPWKLRYCNVEVWVKREPGRIDVMNLTENRTLSKVATIVRGKIEFNFL